MHELPVTEKILNIVVKHAEMNRVSKVISITLKIGELSDLENEWIQHYFDYLSKNTVAENAILKIEKVPIVFKCNQCGHEIEVKKEQLGEIACPRCLSKGNFSLISGREYFIKEMEVR
jgi:hydrogenase nickel incorporation protein HypA/HybF